MTAQQEGSSESAQIKPEVLWGTISMVQRVPELVPLLDCRAPEVLNLLHPDLCRYTYRCVPQQPCILLCDWLRFVLARRALSHGFHHIAYLRTCITLGGEPPPKP